MQTFKNGIVYVCVHSKSYMFTSEITMMSPSPFQVRVVASVELHRPLDSVARSRIWWRGRPPFAGRTWLGNGGCHGGHPREVAMVVVVLLVMVVVVMVVHMQVGWCVQPRAGHRLVLGTAGLGRLHLDMGHLQRLVFQRGEYVWVDHLVHFEPW